MPRPSPLSTRPSRPVPLSLVTRVSKPQFLKMPQECGGTLPYTFTLPLLIAWVQNPDFVVRCGPTHSLPSGLETIPVFPPGSIGNLSPLKGLCGLPFPSEFTQRVAAEGFNSQEKPSEQD